MMRLIHYLTPLLLLLTLLAPALSMPAPPVAHAVPEPALHLAVNAVRADSAGNVAVHGTSFTPRSLVTLRLDDTAVVGTAHAGPQGAFTATAAIPAMGVGRHTLTGTDAAHLSAGQVLYAVSLTLSPDRAPNGMQVTSDGTGFLASQPLVVQLGTTTVISSTTDSSGAFHDTFMVPSSLRGLQSLVLRQGAEPALVWHSTFTITRAVLTLSPSTTGPGRTISLRGTGFAPDWDHALQLDGRPISALHTRVNGAFGPIQFTVPGDIIAGNHTIAVSTVAGHTVAAAALAINVVSPTPTPTLTAVPPTPTPTPTVVPPTPTPTPTVVPPALTPTPTVVPPALTLTPSVGVPGSSVLVNGTGFQPFERVSVGLGTTVLAVATANGSGQFGSVVTLPRTLTAGTVLLQAAGQTSRLIATATFMIPAPTLSLGVTSLQPGQTLLVTGRYFAAYEPVRLTLGTTLLATAVADRGGTFAVNVTVPAAQPAGITAIVAAGQISLQIARANLTVLAVAQIHLSPTVVPEGGTIIVTGMGFGTGEPVVLSIPGFVLHTVVANAQGAFAIAVTIPATAPVSQVTLTATGQQTQRSATAPLTVLAVAAQLTLNPTSVVAGASFQVSGTGFRPGEQVQISMPGQLLATLTASAQGTFATVPVTLPVAVGPGTVTVSARGLSSLKVAGATLLVIPRSAGLIVSPSALTPGTPLRIAGTSFLPGERVAIAVDGSPVATVVAGATGNFVLTTTLPASLTLGSHQITAGGLTSRLVAGAGVQIAAPVLERVGSTTWYFAGGRTDSGYSEQIDVLNTNTRPVQGTITFFYGSNQTRVYPFTVQPQARGTYDAAAILGISTRFATRVQADQPIAAARTSQRGAQALTQSTGVSAPARTWYLAEGYTGLTFQEELDLLNPGNRPAQVHITWMLFNGRPPIVHTVVLAPATHLTIPVNSYVDRASHATVVTADQPIVAGRTMLFGASQQGAHAREGTTQADSTLYFAEGSTTNGFEEYLTILNPHSGQTAQVTASFYNRQGTLLATRVIQVEPLHRGTIKVHEVVRDSAIATVLHATIPIVAERSMYFGAPNGSTVDGTVVFGRATPALGWAFASGDTRSGRSEFELLFNPNPSSSTIVATFYGENGRLLQRTFTLPGHSRLNIDVTLSVPELARGLHGVVLHATNGVAFIAEQALYANAMHSGSATVGTSIG